jgi:multicomponent Na+:H+ antiporter subunit C
MNGYLVLVVGALTALGVYLVTSRILSRIVLGFALLGHAVVLALITAGGPAGAPPLADRLDGTDPADPLPQALSLTAIVISFGLTLFLLALARRAHQLNGDDLVEDDIEDRRIARFLDDDRGNAGADADAADAEQAAPDADGRAR